MQYMVAKLVTRRKEVRSDDTIVEVVIWQLSEPLSPCAHCYKYRLAYVVAGQCVVRYDNERGKGDHRHVGGTKSAYDFSDLSRLLADFQRDVEGRK